MGKVQTRCTPVCVTKLLKILPLEAIQRIKELGPFDELLSLKLDGLGCLNSCVEIMEKAIVHASSNQIEIRIKDDVSLWITKEVVQHVIDMPTGLVKDLPHSEDAVTEYNRMYKALRYVNGKYNVKKDGEGSDGGERDPNLMFADDKRTTFTMANIKLLFENFSKEDVSPLVDRDMIVKLFFGVVLDRLFLPGTSVYVSATTLEAVQGLERLKDMDWSYLVFERLKKACLQFAEKPERMNGCVALLMVVLVDCIEGNHLEIQESGRMYLYTDHMIKNLQEDQIVKKRKRTRKMMPRQAKRKLKLLESIDFMRWEDSCYGKFEVVPITVRDRLHCHRNLDQESQYRKHVSERVRDEIVLDFEHCSVVESIFVDCFKENGYMISIIMDLVCHLWSMDWKDKIILGEFAVKELLKQQNATPCLDKELTEEKVKDVTQIFIPIVSDGHWSLVVICTTTEKIYILDSCPGIHTEVANGLIARLQAYLLSKHNIDIRYVTETPKVEPQDTNCDCGFHVLLYILGFEKMDIFGINKDKVSKFQMTLSMSLLYHGMNRAAPGAPIAIDKDKDKDEEDTVTVISDDHGHPAHSSGNDNLDGGAKAAPLSPGQRHGDTAHSRGDDNLDGGEKAPSPSPGQPSGKTPLIMVGKRTRTLNSFRFDVPKFEQCKPLDPKRNKEIYEFIKTICNDTVLKVGETNMTGVELVTCLEGGDNSLSLINAFVQCLKCDDKDAGHNKSRIIIPPQYQNGEEVAEMIAKELAAGGIADGKKIKQPFLICPILHHGEWFVFFVNTEIKDTATVIHPNDSKLVNDHIAFSEKFVEQVHKAFEQCSYVSPFSNASKIVPSTVHSKSKSKCSVLAAMLVLELFNGHDIPLNLKNETVKNDYKDSKMVHLLLHKENSAKLPPEVMEIVNRKKKGRKGA